MSPPTVQLAKFWSLSGSEMFGIFEHHVDPKTVQGLNRSLAEATDARLKADAWNLCRKAGVRVSQLADLFGVNPGNLRRSLKEGSASDWMVRVAWRLAGFEPAEFRLQPDNRQTLEGVIAAVMAYARKHENEDMSAGELLRVEAAPFRPWQAALLIAVFHDPDVLNQWINLATPLACDFSAVIEDPAVSRFFKQIYQSAQNILARDPQSVAELKKHSGFPFDPVRAVAPFAEVWNPYQVYFYAVHDSVKAILQFAA